MPEQKVKTLEGDELFIEASSKGVEINHVAHVTTADVDATNGVVHIIDAVLIPKHVSAKPTKNIVELAQSVPDLSTLVTAVVAGNLTGPLSGPGPFTVFAPTNEAFGKVPADVLKHLLDPKNIKELDAVLEYHVIAGAAVHAKDLKPEQEVKTLEGDKLLIEASAKGVEINHVAHVTTADVDATNGVVHIIDAVLIPKHVSAKPTKNIVELAQSVPDLSTLVTAVVAGNLTGPLSGPGPFTVFAPTNEAFAKIPVRARCRRRRTTTATRTTGRA